MTRVVRKENKIVTMAPDNRVLVVSLTANPSPALVRIAFRHAWRLLGVSRAPQALREIRRRQPDVVIVQMSPRFDEDVELIRLLPTKTKRVALIAIANSHHDEIERAVRRAGASCYLPAAADTSLVERTVAEMLHLRDAETSTTCRRGGAAINDWTFLSSSSCLPPENPGRRAQSSRRPIRSACRSEDGRVA